MRIHSHTGEVVPRRRKKGHVIVSDLWASRNAVRYFELCCEVSNGNECDIIMVKDHKTSSARHVENMLKCHGKTCINIHLIGTLT